MKPQMNADESGYAATARAAAAKLRSASHCNEGGGGGFSRQHCVQLWFHTSAHAQGPTTRGNLCSFLCSEKEGISLRWLIAVSGRFVARAVEEAGEVFTVTGLRAGGEERVGLQGG